MCFFFPFSIFLKIKLSKIFFSRKKMFLWKRESFYGEKCSVFFFSIFSLCFCLFVKKILLVFFEKIFFWWFEFIFVFMVITWFCNRIKLRIYWELFFHLKFKWLIKINFVNKNESIFSFIEKKKRKNVLKIHSSEYVLYKTIFSIKKCYIKHILKNNRFYWSDFFPSKMLSSLKII